MSNLKSLIRERQVKFNTPVMSNKILKHQIPNLSVQNKYRSGTLNSNTVNSKFHLIKVSVKSLPDSYNFMFKMHS